MFPTLSDERGTAFARGSPRQTVNGHLAITMGRAKWPRILSPSIAFDSKKKSGVQGNLGGHNEE